MIDQLAVILSSHYVTVVTDQLWPDSICLFLVKFVLRLVEEHHVSPVEVKKYHSDYWCK